MGASQDANEGRASDSDRASDLAPGPTGRLAPEARDAEPMEPLARGPAEIARQGEVPPDHEGGAVGEVDLDDEDAQTAT